MRILVRQHPAANARPIKTDRFDGVEVIDVDTGSTVEIWDPFIGPILRNDGVCLSVFARDDGFEFFCWEQPDEVPVDVNETLPAGAMAGRVSPRSVQGWREDGSFQMTVLDQGALDVGFTEPEPEPNLGLATTGELVEELVARWQTSRLGVLDPQYSPVPRPDVVAQRQNVRPAETRHDG